MNRPPVLWIIPTRGRPDQAAALHWQLEATCEVSTWRFAVDDDDPTLRFYLDAGIPERFFVAGARKNLVAWTNQVALDQGGGYLALGSLGDDHWPHARGWDRELLATLVLGAVLDGGVWDGIGFAYGNDLLQGEKLPTAVLMGGRVVEALGYMAPPTFEHLMIDVFWRELGSAVGRLFYREDVIVEHRHPAAGKAPLDESYERNNSPEQIVQDNEAWNAYRMPGGGFDIDARALMLRCRTPWML